VNLPPGKKPITKKWVYKTKLTTNGKVEKLNLHHVTQSFEQKKAQVLTKPLHPH
jgi:hypothetical protein